MLDGADYLGVGPDFPIINTKNFDDFPGFGFHVAQVAGVRSPCPAFAIGGDHMNRTLHGSLGAQPARVAVSGWVRRITAVASDPGVSDSA